MENEGENPAKKSEEESNKNPSKKESLKVDPLDEIISATETETEANGSSISRSTSIV